MPFKVIQVFDKKRTYLEVIPAKWEQNGIVTWPRNALSIRVKDGNSEPDVDFVIQQKCKLKRGGLETYDLADQICELMKQKEDTDNEDLNVSSNAKPLMKKGETALNSVSKIPNLRDLINTVRQ